MNTFVARRYHVDDNTGSFDMLKVRCPECRLSFWVLGLWLVRNGHRRVCPYCGKYSFKPNKEQ